MYSNIISDIHLEPGGGQHSTAGTMSRWYWDSCEQLETRDRFEAPKEVATSVIARGCEETENYYLKISKHCAWSFS